MESLILGVFGEICSGKSLVASLLSLNHNFSILEHNDKKAYITSLIEENTKSNLWKLSADIENITLYDCVKTAIYKEHTRIVIDSIIRYKDYEPFYNKNNFKLIYITAPGEVRFKNYLKKNKLEENIESYKSYIQTDSILSSESWFYKIKERVDYTIINNGDIGELEKAVSYLVQLIQKNPRPTWDRYFMNICHLVSKRSNCLKSRVGAIIVKNNRVLAAGYNGTPSGVKNCFEGGCLRCYTGAKRGVDLDKCWCLHAEENAIVEIGRKECAGATLYTTIFPCILCSKLLLSCGIVRIVYDSNYLNDSDLFESDFTKRELNIEKLEKVVNVISAKGIEEYIKLS
jgi:dCMP deaminase